MTHAPPQQGPARQRQQPPRDRGRTIMNVVIVAVLIALAVAGVARFRYEKRQRLAVTKATQLQAEWRQLGLTVPGTDLLVRLYGTDGGRVCAATASGVADGLLLWMLANGAAGPGQRPVIGLAKVARGERAVVAVYCPQRLGQFDQIINGLSLTSGG